MINKRLIDETFPVIEQNVQFHRQFIQNVEFVEEHSSVAHNVTLACKSWDVDLRRSHKLRREKITFTTLLVGRIFPDVINHKFNTLTKTMCYPLHCTFASANLPAASHESLFSIQIPSLCGFKDSIDRHQGTCG